MVRGAHDLCVAAQWVREGIEDLAQRLKWIQIVMKTYLDFKTISVRLVFVRLEGTA